MSFTRIGCELKLSETQAGAPSRKCVSSTPSVPPLTSPDTAPGPGESLWAAGGQHSCTINTQENRTEAGKDTEIISQIHFFSSRLFDSKERIFCCLQETES